MSKLTDSSGEFFLKGTLLENLKFFNFIQVTFIYLFLICISEYSHLLYYHVSLITSDKTIITCASHTMVMYRVGMFQFMGCLSWKSRIHRELIFRELDFRPKFTMFPIFPPLTFVGETITMPVTRMVLSLYNNILTCRC